MLIILIWIRSLIGNTLDSNQAYQTRTDRLTHMEDDIAIVLTQALQIHTRRTPSVVTGSSTICRSFTASVLTRLGSKI